MRVQIHAFKLLKSGLPIPEKLQQAFNPANGSIPVIKKLLQGPDMHSRIVDVAIKIGKASSEEPELSQTVSLVAVSEYTVSEYTVIILLGSTYNRWLIASIVAS
jgi:hypothetical protein